MFVRAAGGHQRPNARHAVGRHAGCPFGGNWRARSPPPTATPWTGCRHTPVATGVGALRGCHSRRCHRPGGKACRGLFGALPGAVARYLRQAPICRPRSNLRRLRPGLQLGRQGLGAPSRPRVRRGRNRAGRRMAAAARPVVAGVGDSRHPPRDAWYRLKTEWRPAENRSMTA